MCILYKQDIMTALICQFNLWLSRRTAQEIVQMDRFNFRLVGDRYLCDARRRARPSTWASDSIRPSSGE